MSERTIQQMELDLDTLWNNLVTGSEPIRPTDSELRMVELLNSMEAAELPRIGFFDDLWMQILEVERVDSPVPAPSQPPAPVARTVLPLPIRSDTKSWTAYQRWGKLAAVLTVLLAIAAVSTILFAGRQKDDGLSAAAQRWTMTGGDPGKTNGNPDAQGIATPNVQWRVETDGRIEGVPVVSDGVVFIGNQEHHMYAFDAESGLPIWSVNLRKPITGTVAVGDGIVVVETSTSLFGLDAKTGTSLWQRGDLVASSDPTIVDGAIYLADDSNRLRSLDLADGEDRWLSDPFADVPAFAIDERSGRMFVTTPGGMLSALAIKSGTKIWENDPGLGSLGSPLVAGDGVVIPITGGVALVDGATGAVGPKNVVGFESIPTIQPALALSGDLLIASTEQIVLAYERDTLEVAWVNQQLFDLTGKMTAAANSIYLPGKDRTLTALDRETGEAQWTLPLDEVAQVAPAVTFERVFISTRAGSVYAIGGEGASILYAPSAEMEPQAEGPVTPIWKSSGGPNALKNPTGIVVSPTGEIWVCDTASDRLQVFDADGNFLREFGSHGNAPGQFDFGEETAQMDGNAPPGNACALVFDASGALYVTDVANFRVQRFPASSFDWMANACCTIRVASTNYPFPASAAQPDLIIGSEGTGAGQFLFPSQVAVAPNGDIYVGDRDRVDVQRFDANGTLIDTIGKPIVSGTGDQLAVGDVRALGSFVSISGIAVDNVGRLYIADNRWHKVDRLELDGTWTSLSLSRRDYSISGIAVDDQGNVFVAQIESFGGSFAIYDQDGRLLAQVGTCGIGLGEFDATTGVALDGFGHVYLTDWALNRVQKFEIDEQCLKSSTPEPDS